jgi:hypothetical protein
MFYLDEAHPTTKVIQFCSETQLSDPIDCKYSSAMNYGDNDQTILEIDSN